MSHAPKISIIIPTFNAAAHLERCLQSIAAQDYSNVEIIVVDQTSADDTKSIAQNAGATVITIPKPAFYSPPSKSRNIGAKQAGGEIYYHLDADMALGDGLLNEIAELYASSSDVAWIVHEVDQPVGFWSRCKAFERRCYWGNDKIESARVVRAEVFNQIGGYNEEISSGEDMHIHSKYKGIGTVGYCKATVNHHIGSLNYLMLVKKKFQYGKTAILYTSEHSANGLDVLREELRMFALHWKDFLDNPVSGIGMLFLKFSEYSGGALGLIYSKLYGKNG